MSFCTAPVVRKRPVCRHMKCWLDQLRCDQRRLQDPWNHFAGDRSVGEEQSDVAVVGMGVTESLTSYLPRLFTKDMLTDPIGFLKNHLPEPRQLEW